MAPWLSGVVLPDLEGGHQAAPAWFVGGRPHPASGVRGKGAALQPQMWAGPSATADLAVLRLLPV